VGPWAGTSELSNGTAIDSYARSLADLLAGYSSSSSIAYGDPERVVLQHTGTIFAQDSWKITNRLTFTYGLRYELDGTWHTGKSDLSAFIPSEGVVYTDEGISTPYPVDYSGFGPRLGFTYQPKENLGLVVRGGAGIYSDTPALDNFARARASNGGATGFENNPGGSSPVTSLSQQTADIVSGQSFFESAGSASKVGLYTVSQDFRNPHYYSYYLQVEKALGERVVAQIGYVGSVGRNLEGLIDLNPAALNTSSGAVVQSTRTSYAQYPTYAAINQLTSGFSSNYNSLQASLHLKSWHRLQADANYTWAHNLDTLSNVSLPVINTDIERNYGNSSNDVRHALSGVLSYAVPELHGYNALARGVANGWTLTSGFDFYTGQPFTISNGNNDTTGTEDKSQLVDVVGNPFSGVSHALGSSKKITWINPTAFAAPANGTYGNERRNQLRGPGYGDVDLSVARRIPFGERVNGELRAELNNLFDRTNLASPSTTYNSGGSYGLVTGTIGSGGAAGIAAGEPFNVQLQFKLSF